MLVQMSGKMNTYRMTEEKLLAEHPALWMAMIDTADIVAERYGVSREYQDEYALRSQQRIAAAQAKGLFKDEIVPMARRHQTRGDPNPTRKTNRIGEEVLHHVCAVIKDPNIRAAARPSAY
jgi:acetyl-CoA acetyltransferase